MKLQISFDNGTVMRLSGVKTFGFDAEDENIEQREEITSHPEFIQKKIETIKTNN